MMGSFSIFPMTIAFIQTRAADYIFLAAFVKTLFLFGALLSLSHTLAALIPFMPSTLQVLAEVTIHIFIRLKM